MDRRSFLKAVGGAAAAAVAVPALVLPVRAIALSEPARKFFLPPEGGWQPEELRWATLPELADVAPLYRANLNRAGATHYRLTGYYDPDLPLPMPGNTVMLKIPHHRSPVRAMITEYTTEMYTDRATQISVKLVSMPADGPEPLTTINMRHPISWTTWTERPRGSSSLYAGARNESLA